MESVTAPVDVPQQRRKGLQDDAFRTAEPSSPYRTRHTAPPFSLCLPQGDGARKERRSLGRVHQAVHGAANRGANRGKKPRKKPWGLGCAKTAMKSWWRWDIRPSYR